MLVLLLAPGARSAPMPPGWHAPAAWLKEALCIHSYESGDWYRRWVDWRGRPSKYAGGMQFEESTWLKAGGHGEPWQASPREQLYRAWITWDRDRGRVGDGVGSWREWGTAGRCGLG